MKKKYWNIFETRNDIKIYNVLVRLIPVNQVLYKVVDLLFITHQANIFSKFASWENKLVFQIKLERQFVYIFTICDAKNLNW